jgi:antitoxin component of MazEF toxin-antitoxin module
VVKIETSTIKTKENAIGYRIRRIQTILGNTSFSLVLPKEFASDLGLTKGEYVKVMQDKDRIIIERADKKEVAQ